MGQAAISIEDKERDFHDEWARSMNPAEVMVDETFTASTSPESAWLFQQLGDVNGLHLLDLGSGGGESAVWFAKHGAIVTATDLSPEMCAVIQRVAEHHKTSLRTSVCNAEDLSQFPDASFDIVFAANVLHHVHTERCLIEIKRVLKPGGRLASWDPVAYNPVINVYRGMAMEVRTEDEHPMTVDDVKTIKKHFQRMEKKFFWFTSLLVFLKFYLIDRVHPNADRYWKRILTHEKEIAWFYKPLAALDRLLLKIPGLGWWAWNVAIIAHKEK